MKHGYHFREVGALPLDCCDVGTVCTNSVGCVEEEEEESYIH
jgi:hypothetical protein